MNDTLLSKDGVRTYNTGNSYEWWYFDGQLEDGTAFQIHYQAPANCYYTPEPSVMIHLRRPDGTILAREAFCALPLYSSMQNKCDVKIDKSTLIGDLVKYEVNLFCDDITANLIYESEGQPVDGPDYAGVEPYLGWFLSIPYGKVSGTLIYDNQTFNITGGGYHDHNWGVGDLGETTRDWYWGRVCLDELTIVFTELRTGESDTHTTLIVLQDGKTIINTLKDGNTVNASLSDSEFYYSSRNVKEPGRLLVNWSYEDKNYSLAFTSPKKIQETYEFSRLSGLSRTCHGAPDYNPSYMSFLSDAELTIQTASSEPAKTGVGIYEHRTFK